MKKIKIKVAIQRCSKHHYKIYTTPNDYWVICAHFAEDAVRLFESFSIYELESAKVCKTKEEIQNEVRSNIF